MPLDSPLVEITLTVAEQRKIVEHTAGEPCFRMRLTEQEAKAIEGKDFTVCALKDGTLAVWRPRSSLPADAMTFNAIKVRIIDDTVE